MLYLIIYRKLMAGRDIWVCLALAFIRFHSWLPGYAVPLWGNAVLMYRGDYPLVFRCLAFLDLG